MYLKFKIQNICVSNTCFKYLNTNTTQTSSMIKCQMLPEIYVLVFKLYVLEIQNTCISNSSLVLIIEVKILPKSSQRWKKDIIVIL